MKTSAVLYLVGAEILILAWILLGYEWLKYWRMQRKRRREARMLAERGNILRNDPRFRDAP